MFKIALETFGCNQMLYEWSGIGYAVVESGSIANKVMMGEVFACVVKLNLRHADTEIDFKFMWFCP
jgi:hypothetical protein